MIQSEFEALAGYQVSTEDYLKIIEPMYMAVSLSKEEFVKVINKKCFALKTKRQYITEMREITGYLKQTFLRFTDYEKREQLSTLADEYCTRFFGSEYSYLINETMEQSCFYPVSIDFYNKQTGKTIETVDLKSKKVLDWNYTSSDK